MERKEIAIIGGGPAGLMAAEVLSRSDHAVTVYEAMPTAARKFLLAGKSGLNITHSEDYRDFATRFGDASARLRPGLDAFTPRDVRVWAAGLDAETFVGSSGRVFPKAMKASPLLRAWLRRLEAQGVRLLTRHRWSGFAENGYIFDTPE
ncbi:NAD(P)/FAD-dependent oxidoreductase, partial [Sinorhizobium meliloti]